MRIGLMLRHMGRQPGGTGTYTNMMVRHMLAADRNNDYVLLYDDPTRPGSYAAQSNVVEVAVRSPSKLVWDQFVVPMLAWRHRLDVILNLKMTVPLLAHCPAVCVQHGADWFVMPEQYPLVDRLYVKVFARLYWRRAQRIISVSSDSERRLAALMDAGTASKLRTIYHGVDPKFAAPPDPQALDRLRRRYSLQAPFILYLGQIYPMKNVGRLIRAFAQIQHRVTQDLVLVGKPAPQSAPELALIEQLGLGNRVRCIGWVPDQEVPLFYQAADLFAFPSLYEGFGIPIIEAMAARCPVVTSTAGACPEVARDAAILVDPRDTSSIAAGIVRGLTDSQLRDELRVRGRVRSEELTWEKSARQTIDVLMSLGDGRQGLRSRGSPDASIEL